MKGPLDGIRVVDLSRILAGPYCSMILGDYGAEVIKVEIPKVGDDTRQWGPPFTSNGAMSAYFACLNRNKKSITVDFKKKEGLKILKDLVNISDVLLENYLPGKLETMGLGYNELSAINPRLVYCSITGFGPDGPYKNRPGVDVLVEAMAGLISITGTPEHPAKVGVAITDITTGLLAQGAITSALLARERTGRGQKIDCSLLETQVASLVNIASNYLIAGLEPTRMGTAHVTIVPYQLFRTLDGEIMIGATNDPQFCRLMQAIGKPEFGSDPRFKTNPQRYAHRDELIHLIETETMKKTTEEWLKLLESSGISYGPLNNIAQTLNDPQVIHRGMIQEVEHKSYGKIKVTGIPAKFSDTKPSIKSAPPVLGEHTEEILRMLKYSDQEISRLRELGVI